MKLSSHKKISPRSRSNKMQYVTCQSGYRPPATPTHTQTDTHTLCRTISEGIDGMTTVTSQKEYDDPTLPTGYPKFAYPLEMSSGSGILFRLGQPLAGRSVPTAERPADHIDVVYRVVIAGHANHMVTIMTLLSFTEFWNICCPRTIHLFHSDGERR